MLVSSDTIYQIYELGPSGARYFCIVVFDLEDEIFAIETISIYVLSRRDSTDVTWPTRLNPPTYWVRPCQTSS